MRNLFLPFLIFLIASQTPVFADSQAPLPELSPDMAFGDSIPKYVIMKTTSDYSPVREAADVNAKRFSHLKKGTLLFTDSAYKDFFRVDLGLDKPYWIERKYVEKQAEADKKDLPKINTVAYGEDSDYYKVFIKTDNISPYNEIETSANSLDFILYDIVLDGENLVETGLNKAGFKISKDKFENLQISYYSNYPLVGHEVEITDKGLILKVKKPFIIDKRKPLKDIRITIDAGHGGDDSGACSNGLKEKDINLEISKKLESEFKKSGAKVEMTRDDDTNPDLYDRVDFAKSKDADFLLSIHQNSLPNPEMVDKKHGTGVYYYNKEAYEAANSIQKSLLKETKFRDDGVNVGSFALTRTTNPICILIECGYIIHPEEREKLTDEKFQKGIAKAIVEGLENYLKDNFQAK